jgi:hypothetical protein
VTFAMTGLFLSCVLALFWMRLAIVTHHASARARRAISAAAGAGLAVALAWLLHGLTRAAPSVVMLENAKLVDGLAFAVGAFVASGRLFANRRGLALVGPPLAAVVLVLGVSSLRACPPLREILYGQAPGVSWVVGLFGEN